MHKLVRYSSGVWITGGTTQPLEDFCDPAKIVGNVACVGLKNYDVAGSETDAKVQAATIEAIF